MQLLPPPPPALDGMYALPGSRRGSAASWGVVPYLHHPSGQLLSLPAAMPDPALERAHDAVRRPPDPHLDTIPVCFGSTVHASLPWAAIPSLLFWLTLT